MYKVFYTQSVGAASAHAEHPKAPPKRERAEVPVTRIPRWIRTKASLSPNYNRVKSILNEHSLFSVCQEAACPNIRECWEEGTATFMILGKYCTRNCHFCDVLKGQPKGLDTEEPERLARAVAELHLKQVVITSVTRDDLPDGGASIFARTMEALRWQDKDVKVEFLIPDFGGNIKALKTVLDSGVDVLAHNVETVQRLYKRVRPAMKLDRSLELLRIANSYSPRPVVKTGFMVGLGETGEEIVELLYQVYAAGVDIVTVGQYLRPSVYHLPVEKYYTPEEFAEIAKIGKEIGFGHVESGPLVRSSYRAFNQSKHLLGT